MKPALIWFTGLVASAGWGFLLGVRLGDGALIGILGGQIGMLVGPLAFVCLRLWRA